MVFLKFVQVDINSWNSFMIVMEMHKKLGDDSPSPT